MSDKATTSTPTSDSKAVSSSLKEASNFFFGKATINLSELFANLLLKGEERKKPAIPPEKSIKNNKVYQFLNSARTQKKVYFQIADAVLYISIIFLVLFVYRLVDVAKLKAYSRKASLQAKGSTWRYISTMLKYPLLKNQMEDSDKRLIKEVENFVKGKPSILEPLKQIDAKNETGTGLFSLIFSRGFSILGVKITLFRTFVVLLVTAIVYTSFNKEMLILGY